MKITHSKLIRENSNKIIRDGSGTTSKYDIIDIDKKIKDVEL